jgi:adenylate kinase family enzyme
MEALAAVSLAGNILQFVHTTKELISASRNIYDSGAKQGNLELEIIARDLRAQTDRLKVPGGTTSKPIDDNGSLESLASRCEEITQEILQILDKLKLKEDSNKWDSFLQALKTQWREPEIEALRKRLNSIGQTVNARLADERMLGMNDLLNDLVTNNKKLDIARAQELRQLRTYFEDALENTHNELNEGKLADEMTAVADRGLIYSAEQMILSKLRFRRLEDRYLSISSAHRMTLSWLFETGDTEGQRNGSTTFATWLQSEDTLYWISGRPGSGKSTLMKFLCEHPQTAKLLETWAQGEVIVAEYFFWNAAKSELQKSQEGVIRSLLYQILRKCPDYIRLVFPSAWQQYNRSDSRNSKEINVALDTEIPVDLRGLMKAMRHTCDFLAQSEKRLCLFIDGLDEYQGSSVDIIELMGIFRSLPNVKLCVSSRQWNEFEDAYGKHSSTKLYMHDFNNEDISTYVKDVLENDENYQELEYKETHGKALVSEIVSAANGVFLWVVLVVRSLQEGLREGDSIARLQNRLRKLPTDLDEYFERILFYDVQKSYRDQAAQMFLVALVAKDNLPLMAYWFLDEHDLPSERKPLKMQQTNQRHKAAKKRLVAGCKGLLEPHYQPPSGHAELPSSILFEYRVDFLHRTVRDYLELPTTDIKHWAPIGFDPHEAICRAVYSQIKTAPHGHEYGFHVSTLYEIFEFHANTLQASQRDNSLIPELEKELQIMLSDYGIETAGISSSEDAGTKPTEVERTIPMIVEHKVKVSSGSKAHEEPPSLLKTWKSKLSRRRSRSSDKTKHS